MFMLVLKKNQMLLKFVARNCDVDSDSMIDAIIKNRMCDKSTGLMTPAVE